MGSSRYGRMRAKAQIWCYITIVFYIYVAVWFLFIPLTEKPNPILVEVLFPDTTVGLSLVSLVIGAPIGVTLIVSGLSMWNNAKDNSYVDRENQRNEKKKRSSF